MAGLVNRGGFVVSLLAGAIALNTAAFAAVTISSDPTADMVCVSGVCTPTAKKAVLNVNDLSTMLASGNVQINTGSGGLAGKVQDIVVAAGFSWASANSLTLDAYDSITVNQPIADNGSGAVVLTTNDGGSGSVLYFGTKGSLSFLGTENSLTIDGAAFTLGNSIKALATAMAANPSGNFALSQSYDASQDGTYSQSPITVALTGTMEGLGNTISNLSIVSLHHGGIFGLFRAINSNGGGTVEGLVVKGLSIRCTGFEGCSAGGIAGYAGKLLFNDTVSGTLEGRNAELGGLAAQIGGSIVSSQADVTIRENGIGEGTYNGYVGGLVAMNDGTIETSRVSGSVSGAKCVGGLVGSDDSGTIDQSFSTATVTGSDQAPVGGLIGVSNNDVIQVSNSYATGAVNGGSSAEVGGFVGNNSDMTVPIEYSYATGAPAGGAESAVGGFSGTLGYFTDAYWDTTTSGTDQGTGSGNDTGLSGLTTAQLQSGLPAGFDPAIWAETPRINGGLPYLINNSPSK